nr:hypothetical protein [Actinomycetospora chiangmaiensis]
MTATAGEPNTELQLNTGTWVTFPLLTPGLLLAVPVVVQDGAAA